MSKRPRNVPTEAILRGSLEHLIYEFSSILLPIRNYPPEFTEIVEYWQLSHTRLLIDFFGCHALRDTDLVYTDYYGPGKMPISDLYDSNSNQHVKDFISQKLLHLTAIRIGKKAPPQEKLWPTAEFVSPIQRQSRLFIEDVIQGRLKFSLDKLELAEWAELQKNVSNQTPFSSNSGNVTIRVSQPSFIRQPKKV